MRSQFASCSKLLEPNRFDDYDRSPPSTAGRSSGGSPLPKPHKPNLTMKTQIWWVPSIPVTFLFEIYIVRSTHSGVISSSFRLWIQQNLAKINKIQWDLHRIWLNLIGSYEISLDLVIFFTWSSKIFIVSWRPSTIIGSSKSDLHRWEFDLSNLSSLPVGREFGSFPLDMVGWFWVGHKPYPWTLVFF